MKRGHLTDWKALGLYGLLAALFYAPLLSGWSSFPDGDLTFHFVPFSLFLRDELLAGRLPLWNPYTFAGHPFLADVQAAVFYPISNLLLLFTLPWPSAADRLYWLQVEAGLHLAFGGFFTYLLVRELTGQRSGAFLAGCIFAFSSYLTGYPPLQLAVLRTAIWLPLVLFCLHRALVPSLPLRWWLTAALFYAVAFLAGHPQTFFLLSLAVAGWLFLLAWRTRGSGASLLLIVGHVALFYILFLGLVAAQLWPSIEFTRLSVRAKVDYDFLSGGFLLQDSWHLLMPNILTLYSPLYVGVPALGLALLALWGCREAKNRVWLSGILFFASLTLFALLLSYGKYGFLYALLYRWVPGWRLFRGQERAAYLVAFGLSVLAGYGVIHLQTLSLQSRKRFALLFAALCGGGVLLFGYFWQEGGLTPLSQRDFLAIAGITLLLVGLFAAIVGWNREPKQGMILFLTLLVVSNLFWANSRFNLAWGDTTTRMVPAPEVVAMEEAVRARAGMLQGTTARSYNEYRVDGNYGMFARVEEIWGNSPLRLATYATLFDEFPLDRLWRLTGVEHLFTWRRELFEPSTLLAEFPKESDSTYLHRLTEPNPRAWVVSRVQVVDNAEAKQRLADHGFDLEQSALLGMGEDAMRLTEGQAERSLAEPGENQVRLETLAPSHVRIHVASEHGGLLVLSENWMPGWHARRLEAHGRETPLPVLRADLAFLGIPVPAGESILEVYYWPNSIRYGLLISGATLLVMVVAWAIARPIIMLYPHHSIG